MRWQSMLGDADWVAAYGQVAGAAFTALAVVAALWLARVDSRVRHQEARRRAEAQYRLVITADVRVESAGNPPRGNVDRTYYSLTVPVENISEQPILDLLLDVVISDCQADDPRLIGPEDPRLEGPGPWRITGIVSYVKAGETATVETRVSRVTHMTVAACTLSWLDADGTRWKREIRPVAVNRVIEAEAAQRVASWRSDRQIRQELAALRGEPEDDAGEELDDR